MTKYVKNKWRRSSIPDKRGRRHSFSDAYDHGRISGLKIKSSDTTLPPYRRRFLCNSIL